MHHLIIALPSQGLVGSSSMPIVLFLKLLNKKHRLHLLPLKLSILLSSSLRDVIPIMDVAAEIRNHDYQVICTSPNLFCKMLEDNAGALECAWYVIIIFVNMFVIGN